MGEALGVSRGVGWVRPWGRVGGGGEGGGKRAGGGGGGSSHGSVAIGEHPLGVRHGAE